MEADQLSLFQLRTIFKRHYGQSAQLAHHLELSRTTVFRWMQGKFVSRRIELAVRAKAAQLLADEEASERHL
jgi:hypothetical protein